MPRIAKELSALAVSKLSAEGAYAVGGVPGLQLQIIGTSKVWVLRFSINGKRRRMGLGSYPAVSLANAREAGRQAQDLIRSGNDPIDDRDSKRRSQTVRSSKMMSFSKAAERFISIHEPTWTNNKHYTQWVNTLATYAQPVIGSLAVDEVEQQHILQILEPIWKSKTETASRVRGRIEQILNWATVQGMRTGPNPARWRNHLDILLPAPDRISPVKHHPAVTISDAKAIYESVQMSRGYGSLVLQLQILTAVRSGEARGACWSEIDLEGRTWIIPSSRMKAKLEHRVPLSDQAMLLIRNQPMTAGTDLIFPSSSLKPLSDMTLTAVMRRLKLSAVPHGWRSTFRDWVGECTDYPGELAEKALAHSVGSKVEQAYLRGDMLQKRRQLMQDWADFISPTP